MVYFAKEGHLASSYSVLEIIYSLYASGRVSPNEGGPGHFVLSKGHAALALYVVLNEVGAIEKKDLDSYCQPGSLLAGHPNHKIPGVTFSTGSLGHGINYAVGLCLSILFIVSIFEPIATLDQSIKFDSLNLLCIFLNLIKSYY